MIPTRELHNAIAGLLKSKFPTYAIVRNHAEKITVPTFVIESNSTSKSLDNIYYDRLVQVDIAFVPLRDSKGRLNYTEFYNMIDSLDVLIRPIFYVQNRAITVLNTEHTIVDDVLHFIFTLDFTDAWTDEEKPTPDYELMGTLELGGLKYGQ